MLVDLCQVKYLQALSLPVHAGACQGKPSDRILGSGSVNLWKFVDSEPVSTALVPW
jgi:hypothetical protein